MNVTQGMKLRHWIITGYAVPIAALMISAGVTVMNVNTVSQKANELKRSADINEKVDSLAVNTQMMSRLVRGYMLDANPESANAYRKTNTHAQKDLADLQTLVRDSQQQSTLENVETLFKGYTAANGTLVTLVSQGKMKAAIATWKRQNLRETITDLTTELEKMQSREKQIVELHSREQEEALNGLKLTLMVATGSSLLLSMLIGYWVISRTARRMNEAASAIAASTTEIATTVEQQERTANQQAASVNETTTTMDELGASSRQSAEQAEASVTGARQALNLADNGTKAVDRTLVGMDTLKSKVGAIAEQIMRLSEQTNQIGNISGLVSDLANQTNMLALNAAVEAVRAGEHGKGFAVVAAEIRKLADQSKNSAEKINALVSDIQSAINSTVMATDEGTKTVDEGVRIAQETASSFNGVADAVNNVVLNSQQISLNVKQQAIAIQQVVTAMNSLNVAAQETATGIGQIRIGTQRLNDSAQDLKAVV